MAREIFVNLPVKDLQKSIAFFTALGFTFNPKFTDANATCMVIAEGIHVMLLVEPFFATFLTKPQVDAHKGTEVILCISAQSKEEVDTMVALALKAGGTTPRPVQDYGMMYLHSFYDLDGHVWEVTWMDLNFDPSSAGS
jgi:uncharacterized protein